MVGVTVYLSDGNTRSYRCKYFFQASETSIWLYEVNDTDSSMLLLIGSNLVEIIQYSS